MPYCQNCGSPLEAGKRFCSECGAPTGDNPTRAVTPAPKYPGSPALPPELPVQPFTPPEPPMRQAPLPDYPPQ